MSSQLWSDKYIHQHFDDLVDEFVPDPSSRPLGYASNIWRLLAFEMRDDLNARIAALEAQLGEATRWVPLPDGEVSSFAYVDNGGKLLGVFAGDDYPDWYATEDLPDNIRLCRRAEKGDDE